MVTTPAPLQPPAAVRFTDFNAPLDTVYDEDASEALDSDYWRIAKPFKFYLDDPSENKWVLVPAQYLSDGASVPRWFWEVLPPWGRYGQAAVVHDWLCENLKYEQNGQFVTIDRSQADKAFKEAMIALNVPRGKRNVMYIAVRVYAAYMAIRARLGHGDIHTTKSYMAKQAYLAAHPIMEGLDAEGNRLPTAV